MRPGFDPCMRKIPWSRERLPTSVFWAAEFSMDYTVHGVVKSRTQPNNFLCSDGLSAPLVAKTAGFYVFIKKNNNLFIFYIYLLGLGCDTPGSSLHPVGNTGRLVVACGLSHCTACGNLVPRPGLEPASPALQGRSLTTGRLGRWPLGLSG